MNNLWYKNVNNTRALEILKTVNMIVSFLPALLTFLTQM